MKKIINTLKYGSAYTKKIMFFALLDIIAFIAFIVFAIMTKQIVYFFGCVACVFIFISLIQTMSIHGFEGGSPETAGNDVPKKKRNSLPKESADRPKGDFQNKAHDASKVKVKKTKTTSGKSVRSKRPKKRKGIHFSLKELFGRGRNTGKKNIKPEKQNVKTEKQIEKKQPKNTADKKSNAEDKNDNERKLVVIKQVSDDTADTYDRKKIKKTLHKYKVRRDHRLVLVDFSKKYMIKQCPAYIWVADNKFNILLLEEETRHLLIPLGRIREITYLKKQSANVDTDYPLFHKKNMLTNLFRPYLPDYTYNTVASDMNSYKNLYGIAGGIYFTNKSAKNLFDLLGVEFRVDDKVTMSNKVNIFFKDAYKANILLRDSVLDANGYADSIANTLDNMARSTIGYNEFKETLNLMVRNKLITQEFAMHYMNVWDKVKR